DVRAGGPRPVHEERPAAAEELEIEPAEAELVEPLGGGEICAHVLQLREVRAKIFVEYIVSHLGEAREGAVRRCEDGEIGRVEARDLDMGAVTIRERRRRARERVVRERLQPPVEDGQIALARA